MNSNDFNNSLNIDEEKDYGQIDAKSILDSIQVLAQINAKIDIALNTTSNSNKMLISLQERLHHHVNKVTFLEEKVTSLEEKVDRFVNLINEKFNLETKNNKLE